MIASSMMLFSSGFAHSLSNSVLVGHIQKQLELLKAPLDQTICQAAIQDLWQYIRLAFVRI